MDYFCMSQEEQGASENPCSVLEDEDQGRYYMRAVGNKGLGDGAEMEWFIKGVHEEPIAWAYTGGCHLILEVQGRRRREDCVRKTEVAKMQDDDTAFRRERAAQETG